ncbi:deoxynucleotide monophosphate kinase family protein [Sporosarcina sp. FSL W7-1283]|uniref:deoxynucleotide monophosphate kinase family protein n=1 Tax=Sporosarcina sp. FSL W7-1283 TaxID=2921560 RepID=UPI0030FC457A
MNIVLVSEAASGKDFTSDILTNLYGYTRYAFADEVKEVAARLFPDKYNEIIKDRKLLQEIGTKMREIDPEVWIKTLFRKIDSVKELNYKGGYAQEVIVVTDCRLPNEYEALKKAGYTFIRIVADEDVRKQRMIDRGDIFTDDDLKHHTESFYDTFECDYVIENNETEDELKSEVDRVFNAMKHKES